MRVLATITLLVLPAVAADVIVRRDGPVFRVAGLGTTEPAGGWSAVFQVHVGPQDLPPVMGTYVTEGSEVVFKPRFPVSDTVDCRVVAGGTTIVFPGKASSTEPSAHVRRVFPTAWKIPANQLKFYAEFSAPMEKGQAWERIRLKNSVGETVDLAFLEIEQELWDREGKRLTLLFDPGRIKRGVLPREQTGAALRAGETYTLIIDQEYRDAEGVPMKQGYFKVFQVEPEDRAFIDPAKWEVRIPRAGTRDSLAIAFGESIDGPLAQRLISVEGVAGAVELGAFEALWRFVPEKPWEAKEYKILVDTALEDLAGNRVGRPFDVDVFERITVRTDRRVVTLPFRVPRK
ncbi:MAG: hypothetical protein FJW30_04435 [Acidobacteria bacterium]|nr:hypothetical protein [Acidobacteriota bacterium]